jgi:hypothetical protein
VSEIASRCALATEAWKDPDFDLESGSVPLPLDTPKDVEWVQISEVYGGGGELFLHSRGGDQRGARVDVGAYDSSAFFAAVRLLSYAQIKELVIAYDAYANVYGTRLFINGEGTHACAHARAHARAHTHACAQ